MFDNFTEDAKNKNYLYPSLNNSNWWSENKIDFSYVNTKKLFQSVKLLQVISIYLSIYKVNPQIVLKIDIRLLTNEKTIY